MTDKQLFIGVVYDTDEPEGEIHSPVIVVAQDIEAARMLVLQGFSVKATTRVVVRPF